jgi:hypothetical protein
MSGPLWEPPKETLETIAAALTSHWNAAAKAYREKLFWPEASSWLGAFLSRDGRDEWPAYHFTKGGRLIK